MPIFKPKPEQIQRNLMENELQFGREQTAMELSESPVYPRTPALF